MFYKKRCSVNFAKVSRTLFFYRIPPDDCFFYRPRFFLVISVRCMRDVILLSGSEKAMMQFQIVLCMISKIKQLDTRVNSNRIQ